MFHLGNDSYGYVNLMIGDSDDYSKPSVQIELIVGERGSRELQRFTSSEFAVASTYEDLRSIMRLGEDIELYLLDIGQERARNIIKAVSTDSTTLDCLVKSVLAQEGHLR